MSHQTIEARIVAWAGERPTWQQWALKQFAAGAVPSEQFVSALADAIVEGAELKSEPLVVGDIPGPAASAEPVTLVEIAGVDNVNALSSGQTLSFAAEGLTVVYGKNGSGKSGYARLVKELVGGRHPEPVRPNVFDAEATGKPQHALVAYRVGAADKKTAAWPAERPTELRAIGFYDEHCGNAYLLKDSELFFRPSALTLLDSLIACADRLREILDQRIALTAATQPRLPTVPEGTAASEFVRKLSGRTSAAEIDSVTDLPDDFADQLENAVEAHARLQASNPVKERERLSGFAQGGRRIATHLRAVDAILGSAALGELDRLQSNASDKRAAARAASERSFDDLPLSGVGSGAWRALWSAAEDYARIVDAEHEFPHLGEGATCVLCQRQLDADSRSRFARFRDYVADQTEQQARIAERAYDVAFAKVRELRTQDPSAAMALAKMRSADEALADAVDAKLAEAEHLRQAIVDGSDRRQADLTELIARLDEWSGTYETRAAAVDDGTFAADVSSAAAKRDDLKAREALASAKTDILKAVEVRAEVARLNRLRDSCETGAITKKASALEAEFVTAAVSDRFISETHRLSLDRIQLKRTGAGKGRTKHRPDLLGASSGNVMEVLSEGEQTALSLAGQLTEAAFDPTKSAIVLDDPVTSLDHERREKVARRLVELAGERQIIVFTHDMSFVRDLKKAAEASDIPLAERYVQRQGKRSPGIISEAFPWAVKDASARLHDLEQRLGKLEKERADLADAEYEERIALITGSLSQVWERILSNEFVGEVYNAGKGEVQVAKLKILARFSEQDNHDIQVSYGRVSGWAPRHDQPVEDNFTPPEIGDVREEIEKALELFKRIKKYRN